MVYRGPIEAPIQQGQELAELVIKPQDLPEIRRPLVAEHAVPKGGFGVKIRTAAEQLIKRFLNGPSDAS